MSDSGASTTVPPGVGQDDNQNPQIILSITAVLVLALACVGLRLFARLSRTGVTGPGLGIDDYAVLVATVFTLCNAACCLTSVSYGGGRHIWAVSPDDQQTLHKLSYISVTSYIWAVTGYKISILLFYRRIFGTSKLWWVVLSTTIAQLLEVTIAWAFVCRPISYFWKQYTDTIGHGTCFNIPVFYLVNGVISISLDIAILATPMPITWKLNMSTRRKAAVTAVLLLGLFVCAASILRLVTIGSLFTATDETWDLSQVYIWSCVEPFTGLICACLPTYTPLLRHWSTIFRTRRSKGSGAEQRVSNNSQAINKWRKIDKLNNEAFPADEGINLVF